MRNSDPFDELLGLEDAFFAEGFELGQADGERAGRLEGRAFGIEKGFAKYLQMGRLHGHAVTFSGRLQDRSLSSASKEKDSSIIQESEHQPEVKPLAGPRLESHIRTLYALTEPDSLSTENNEEAMTDFDDRLRRAEGKVKIINKLIGESPVSDSDRSTRTQSLGKNTGVNDANIEDASVLSARH